MIYTENTPNPNSVKFLGEKKFSEIGTLEFQKKNLNNIKNNFIKDLLNFNGVELVLISEDFISVKKNEETNWDSLKPSIISLINDYFEKNTKPVLTKKNKSPIKKNDKIETEIENKIKEVLDSKIRPAVSKDGGDISFISFHDGKVKVELRGSCSGCPSSMLTLKNGVQNLLRHYVKEVNEVEAV